MSRVDDFRDQMFQLPPEERAGLALDLLLSLESAPLDTESDSAWAEVIRERADQVAAGNFEAVEWRDSVAQARAMLAERRSS